jgi:hypothetical protein
MLKLHSIALVVVVLIAMPCWGLCSSQEPPKIPYAQQSNAATNAKSDDNKIAKSWGERLSAIWDRTLDDPVAFYTFVLAIFTAVLAIVAFTQIGFLIRSDKTARVAADAAKLSADAIVRVELPLLALKSARLIANGQEIPGGRLPAKFKPEIFLTNWGRSPAEITHGCLEWSVINKLPSRPEYKNIVPYAPGIMVINRANIPLDVPCQINLAPAQIDAIDTSQDRLWVFGFIRFKDFLGEPHDVRFCLKWAVHPQRGERHAFVWDDGTPPEYTKRT